MAANIINGADLMVFVNGKSIAAATSHTLTLSTTMLDLTSPGHKDLGTAGAAVNWTEQVPQTNGWSASTENLFSIGGEGKNFVNLYDLWHNGTKITGQFARIEPHDPVPTGGYSYSYSYEAAYPYYEGEMYITNITANAPYEGKATFTVEFQGSGKLERTPAPAQD